MVAAVKIVYVPRHFLLFFIPVAFSASLIHAEPLAAHQSVWSHVYTSAQASRGQSVFDSRCSSCHQPNLSGYGNLLRGEAFMDHWREDTVGSFFRRTKSTMPQGAAGSLSDAAYVDVVAFILQENGFPAGKAELTHTVLDKIQIEEKDGPKPVPEFALVKVAGCLVQDSAGAWEMDHAGQALRTRNPKESSDADLKSAASFTGAGTFRFLNVSQYDANMFKLANQKGNTVEAKGFLMRKPDGNVLNLTSVTTIAPTCLK